LQNVDLARDSLFRDARIATMIPKHESRRESAQAASFGLGSPPYSARTLPFWV
jgi:hypothetical protein